MGLDAVTGIGNAGGHGVPGDGARPKNARDLKGGWRDAVRPKGTLWINLY